MNPEQIQNAIDFAKKNPNDPRAVELRRRMESGQLNYELESAGMKTFPVPEPPKPQLAEGAVASAVQTATGGQAGPMSSTEAPERTGLQKLSDILPMPLAIGLDPDKAKDARSAIIEPLKTLGTETLPALGKIAMSFGKEDGALRAVEGSGQFFGSLGEAVGEFVSGVAKIPFTPEQEQQIAGVVQEAAQAVGDTEAVQTVVNWYDQQSPETKASIDAIGGAAALAADILTLRGSSMAVEEVLKQARRVAPKVGEAVGDVTRATGDTTGAITKALTPNTGGMAESIIAGINRINPSKRQEFKMQQGVSEEQWLKDRGIIGTREQTVEQLATNYQAMRKNVDEALDQIPGTYRDERITTVADEVVEYASKVESPQAGRMQELAEKAKGVGLTVSEINELKRFYEGNVRTAYLKDIATQGDSAVRATNRDSRLREYLFEIADKNGFDNLREINKEIQASRFLADEIAGKMEGQAANNAMSLTDWMVATPGLTVNPQFLAAFGAKKLLSTEAVRAMAAKALAGFPKTKDLPRADLADITKRAQEVLKKQEDLRQETQKAAILADELQKAGYKMSEGEKGFIIENPIPLTRNEQALIRAAENAEKQRQIVEYILEQRLQGKAVGEGFTMQDVDNVPILNPQSRFDNTAQQAQDLYEQNNPPYKNTDIKF